MSYLLTEIALEMLGYKFYDTNGVFHLTNFQQSMAAVQHDIHPNEPSLTEFIDMSPDEEPKQNGHENAAASIVSSTPEKTSTKSAISVDFRTTPIRALAKMMANDGEKATNGQEQSQSVQQSKHSNSSATFVTPPVQPKMSTRPRRTPTKALARILEYESSTIRSQIAHRLEASLRQKVSNPGDQDACLKEEKMKIMEDAEDMHKFRQFLENRLCCIDNRPYTTYLRTFGVE